MSEAQIPAAEFKAHCLQLLDGVQKSGQSLVVTKRGRPVARVTPISSAPTSLFGCLKGQVDIAGDLVQSTGEAWEADAP